MLMQYAKANRLPNPTYFIDDGYSGVTYDRPGFQKMLSEIEAGNVGTVITKDLSRLGRNSALKGLYINYTFPQYGVRYIAVNDHFDTIDPNSTDNDIAGIKNWFNEFFVKDTSRKIRAVNKAKGERGEQLRWVAVSLYPLDKLFQILCLSFLFFNNLLQTYDLCLEVFLFLCVALVHHSKAFIVNLSRHIVLVGTNEQAVKFTDTLLCLCQTLLMYPKRFLALHTELFFHL